MISISAEPVNIEQVARGIAHIPGAIERAAKNAIRRTLRGARKDAGTLAKKRYTLPAGIVTRSLSIKVSGFSGEMTSKGFRNPLEKAKTNPKGRIKQRGKYIRAVVVRGQGGIIKRAFRKSGGTSIFERVGASRFPIRKLKTVSAPSMVSHPTVSIPVINKMEQRLGINFLHEASAILGGF